MEMIFLSKCRGLSISLTTLVATFVLCAFDMDESFPDDPPTQTKSTVSFAHLNPQPDSVSIAMLGHDVATIVCNSKKAVLFHLNSMEPPADNDTTIGGIKVMSRLGTLNKSDLMPIQFLMADSLFFNNSPVTVTSPYAPNYALSFFKGKQRIDLTFSLASGEVGIVENGVLQRTIRYTTVRDVTRFFRLISSNEFYDDLIRIQ